MYLIDTNIISETIKKQPNKHVIEWLNTIDGKNIFLSVLTIGEIRKCIEKIPDSAKKNKITQWLENDLTTHFQGRMISIDSEVADKWGYLCSLRSMPAIDTLIAATALVHNLKLVTRNTKDFQGITGLELINPWLST